MSFLGYCGGVSFDVVVLYRAKYKVVFHDASPYFNVFFICRAFKWEVFEIFGCDEFEFLRVCLKVSSFCARKLLSWFLIWCFDFVVTYTL